MNPILALVLESFSRQSLSTTQECPVVEAPEPREDDVDDYLPPDVRPAPGRPRSYLRKTHRLAAVEEVWALPETYKAREAV